MIVYAAGKFGARVLLAGSRDKPTQACHVCGCVDKWDAKMSLTHTCSCGATWDQDFNNCKNKLAAYASGKLLLRSPVPLAHKIPAPDHDISYDADATRAAVG